MKNCLVFGSGRSGTSLLMSLFKDSNYNMGPSLYAATESNPTGYYESPLINKINETILKEKIPYRFLKNEDFLYRIPYLRNMICQINYNKQYPIFGQRWLSRIPLDSNFQENEKNSKQIKKIIQIKPFCLKDPRFSYTLPVWRRFINEEETIYLVVFRHPSNTIESIYKECNSVHYLKNKIKISKLEISKIWSSYYEHILKNYQEGGNWIFIHYEQILTKTIVDRLTLQTGAIIDASSVNKNYNRSKTYDKLFPEQEILYRELCDKSGYHPKHL